MNRLYENESSKRFTVLQSTVKTTEKVRNMFKINNKDIGVIDVFWYLYCLTLNISHIFF